MISDSPYRTIEPVLAPVEGAVAGMVASLLMLPAISLLQPLSGLSTNDLLVRIGRTAIPYAAALRSDWMLLIAGVLYALVGGLLGCLYAVSQDRAPVSALVTVGVFYGFVIWVGSRVITSLLFGSVFRASLRSYAWLLACLLYGVLLAGYAVWADSRRPHPTLAAPID